MSFCAQEVLKASWATEHHLFRVDSQRLQLWLSVLGLAFSLWGIIMLQIDGFQPLTLLCATAAMVCLCGLLHNTVRRVLIELPSSAYVTAGAGMFLLWVGLVVNTVVLLRAAGA